MLEMAGMQPSKKWGQNFLLDPRIHQRIVETACVMPHEPVIEIGPGLGHLTQRILAAGADLTAVEIDARLVQYIQETFAQSTCLRVLNIDALASKHSLHQKLQEIILAFQSPYKVIANLPYNIAAPLILAFWEFIRQPKLMVVMVQREVAQRLMAAPGTSEYGPLSLFIQMHAQVIRVLDVPPHVFYPRPKVHSTVIQIIPAAVLWPIQDKILLKATIFTLFNCRRKTIANALRHGTFLALTKELADTALQTCQLDPTKRAETLTLQQFISLSNCLWNLGIAAKEPMLAKGDIL